MTDTSWTLWRYITGKIDESTESCDLWHSLHTHQYSTLVLSRYLFSIIFLSALRSSLLFNWLFDWLYIRRFYLWGYFICCSISCRIGCWNIVLSTPTPWLRFKYSQILSDNLVAVLIEICYHSTYLCHSYPSLAESRKWVGFLLCSLAVRARSVAFGRPVWSYSRVAVCATVR